MLLSYSGLIVTVPMQSLPTEETTVHLPVLT